MARTLVRFAAAVALLLAALLPAGCGLFDSSSDLETVSDPGGLFHVKVPVEWSSLAQPDLMIIYAGEELPEDERLDNLSVAVFSTKDATQSAPAVVLKDIVDERARQREWTDSQISEPAATDVGGREAWVVEASATDQQGVAFNGRYYYVRTSGRDVLIMAVAPSDRWDSAAEDVSGLVQDEWYWHLPADATSDDESGQ